MLCRHEDSPVLFCHFFFFFFFLNPVTLTLKAPQSSLIFVLCEATSKLSVRHKVLLCVTFSFFCFLCRALTVFLWGWGGGRKEKEKKDDVRMKASGSVWHASPVLSYCIALEHLRAQLSTFPFYPRLRKNRYCERSAATRTGDGRRAKNADV